MEQLELVGDAQLLFTAPAFVSLPGAEGEGRVLDRLDDLTGVEVVDDDWAGAFKGSLTFHDATPADVVRLDVGGSIVDHICGLAERHAGLPVEHTEVQAMAFADSSLSVSVSLRIPSGWTDRRERLVDGFGPARRDGFVAGLRECLLGWGAEQELVASDATDTVRYLPYFNLTYVGEPAAPRAGRAVIDHGVLRDLVYPSTSAPLPSHSPLLEEYLYAGYAFSLLGVEPGSTTPAKLRDLLLILDVVYGQLAGAAETAERDLAPDAEGEGPSVEELEGQLRRRYQEVVTPTFSYDHHLLSLRSAILDAWGTEHLLQRSQELLRWSHERQTQEQLEAQARRTKWVNVALTAIGLLAVFDTANAVIDLFDKAF